MPDTEPDNYSIDEMMRRLQTRSDSPAEGEPQLVTRADGSQMIKVRKRKRRSHQPHKEAEKSRRRRTLVVTSLGMVLLMTAALAFIGWFFYLNSDGYQGKVTERIEAWTGARLESRAFRATPVNVAADLVELTWPEDLPAARLKLQLLRGDLKISSHLTGIWEGQQLGAAGGELILRAAPGPGAVDLPEGPLPFRMPLRVNQFNVRFGDGERAALIVSKANATLTVADPARPEANVVLQRGSCRLGGWGRFDVDFASLLLGTDGVRLGSVRLSPEGIDDAEFEVVGEGFPAIPVAGGQAAYGLRVRSMPSLVLFGGGLGALIEGTFETAPEDDSGRVSLDPTVLESLSLDAPVSGTTGSMLRFYRFPMFEVLGEVLDTARFVQPRFDPESSLRVVRSAETVALEDLDLLAEGMMRVRGRIEEGKGGGLSGTLEVGVAESFFVLAANPAMPVVFDKSVSGYRWATVTLSGTTRAPADDLAEQLASNREAIPPASGGQRGLEDEFFDLTTPED